MELPTVHSKDELISLIGELGFLPAFAGHIPGFSAEECIASEYWFPATGEGFWEWKGPVIQKSGCAYGKFLKGRACFMSPEWFCEFANVRRDGYDFDARYEDGLAKQKDKQVFDKLWEDPSQLSSDLRRASGARDFEAIMTRLQMLGYVVISNFEYQVTKAGIPYGWGVTRYETPEYRFGASFTENVYRRKPLESRAWLLERLHALLPEVSERELLKLIG